MLREEKQSRENLAEETRRDVNDIEQRISRLLETEMDVLEILEKIICFNHSPYRPKEKVIKELTI